MINLCLWILFYIKYHYGLAKDTVNAIYLPDSDCISPKISLSFSLLGFFVLKLSLGDLFGVFKGLGDFMLNLSLSTSFVSNGNAVASVELGDGLLRDENDENENDENENDPALLGDRLDCSDELGLFPTGIKAGLFNGSILIYFCLKRFKMKEQIYSEYPSLSDEMRER